MNEGKDLVNHKYLTVNVNILYCSDITQLSSNGYLAFVLDAGSRLILSHCVTSQEPSSEQLIEMVEEALRNRQPRPNVSVFHSDRGSQYTSYRFQEFLKEACLVSSLARPQSHGNQLAEVLNRTLKRYIRARLVDLLGREKHAKTRLSLLVKKVNFEVLSDVVNKAIEYYCSKPHKGLDIYGSSPFDADQALTIKSCGNTSITRNDNKEEALRARASKAHKIEVFAQNEQYLFMEGKNTDGDVEPLSPDTKLLLRETRGLAQQNASIGATLALQNRALYEQNRKLEAQVRFLVEEAETAKKEREEKQARKSKRQNAQKQKQRDAATPEEFNKILEMVGENTYKHARIRVALLIMYFTGLRVSNLLKLTIKHMDDLIREQEMTISIIKKGPSRHKIVIGNVAKKALEKAMADITLLRSNKEPGDMLFTAGPRKGSTEKGKSLSRETFDRQINEILRKGSVLLGKHFRSHSFRATFINTLLEEGIAIHKVKEIVGHCSIKSTAAYQRSFLGKKELREIIGKLSKAQSVRYVRKVKKK